MYVFDPTASSQNKPLQPGQRLDGLAGKVVGFIDNGKPNFNNLVDDLAELLVNKYGVVTVIKRGKRGGSVPASDEVMAELSERCDVVIVGSAD